MARDYRHRVIAATSGLTPVFWVSPHPTLPSPYCIGFGSIWAGIYTPPFASPSLSTQITLQTQEEATDADMRDVRASLGMAPGGLAPEQDAALAQVRARVQGKRQARARVCVCMCMRLYQRANEGEGVATSLPAIHSNERCRTTKTTRHRHPRSYPARGPSQQAALEAAVMKRRAELEAEGQAAEDALANAASGRDRRADEAGEDEEAEGAEDQVGLRGRGGTLAGGGGKVTGSGRMRGGEAGCPVRAGRGGEGRGEGYMHGLGRRSEVVGGGAAACRVPSQSAASC